MPVVLISWSHAGRQVDLWIDVVHSRRNLSLSPSDAAHYCSTTTGKGSPSASRPPRLSAGTTKDGIDGGPVVAGRRALMHASPDDVGGRRCRATESVEHLYAGDGLCLRAHAPTRCQPLPPPLSLSLAFRVDTRTLVSRSRLPVYKLGRWQKIANDYIDEYVLIALTKCMRW